MKICFFGVGGVGGYFGTLVTDRFQGIHDIYFIARGKHKDAICANGLTLKKDGSAQVINVSPTLCTDNVDDLPVCDIIFLSVKGYDLANAARLMNKITREKTLILPLLNGVDIHDRIRQHLNTGIVLPSCVYIGTHIESPGVISQNGGSASIFIGRDPGLPGFYPEPLLSLLNDAQIRYTWEEDIAIAIWSKYLFIAAFGLVTATYNKTLGEVLENSELSMITKAIMYEIEKIAQRLEIPLSPGIVQSSFLKAEQFPYDTKTSFQRDVESKGKVNESDLFGGTLIRYSQQFGVAIPAIRKVYDEFSKKFE